jgi:putative FmdB family regulatory protein
MIYEYVCDSCEKEFDLVYVIGQEIPPRPPCPNCGSRKTSRIWNAPLVKFNTDGFYSTDKEKNE